MTEMERLLENHPHKREEIKFFKPFDWLNHREFEDVVVNDVIKESWEYTLTYSENIVEYAQAGSGISYLGNVGVGKTLQMSLLFKFACYTGLFRPCQFVYMHDAIAAFTGQRKDYDRDPLVRQRVMRSQFLCLDDVGVENKTEYNKSIIESIFVERYNAGLPTILTSNLSIEEFDDRYGTRITDRLGETNRTFELVGDSYRKPTMFKKLGGSHE